MILALPGRELHEFADVGEGVDEQEEAVPQADTREHRPEVQPKIRAHAVDYCKANTHTSLSKTSSDC